MNEFVYKISQATTLEENKSHSADTSGKDYTFTVANERKEEMSNDE